MAEHRAHFDFDIRFANGGGMTGEGFRLDLPRPELDSEAIGMLLVQHLGLALVESVTLTRLSIVEEIHRGTLTYPVSPPRPPVPGFTALPTAVLVFGTSPVGPPATSDALLVGSFESTFEHRTPPGVLMSCPTMA